MRGLGLGLRLGRGRGISVSVGAINPVFVSDSFTTGSAGNPAALTATFTYAGADTLEMVGVTSTSGTAPSKANIEAGTGTGSLEEFVKSFTSGADTPITGLTSTSETATHIHYFIREVNNGGESAVQTQAVSGLDFTPSVVSAAVTNVAGTEVTLTMSAATWHDAIDTADWALTGAGANSRTITGISGNGTTSIVLTLSGAVAAGTLSLAYTDSDSNLRDASGNPVADFSGQNVVNNLSTGPTFIAYDFDPGPQTASGGLSTPVSWTLDVGAATVGKRIYVAILANFTDPDPSTVTVGGVSATRLNGDNPSANVSAAIWYVDSDSLAGSVTVTASTYGSLHFEMAAATYAASGVGSHVYSNDNGTSATSTSLSLNVSAGDLVFSTVNTGNGGQYTWTGLTERDEADARSNEWVGTAHDEMVSTDAAYAVTTAWTPAAAYIHQAVVIKA